jgi:hypothetical protein
MRAKPFTVKAHQFPVLAFGLVIQILLLFLLLFLLV